MESRKKKRVGGNLQKKKTAVDSARRVQLFPPSQRKIPQKKEAWKYVRSMNRGGVYDVFLFLEGNLKYPPASRLQGKTSGKIAALN